MKNFSGFLSFRIDSSLSQELRKSLDVLLSHFKDAHIEDYATSLTLAPGRLVVDFISENSLHLIKESPSFKICLLDKNQGLFSFGQNIEVSQVDAILDDSLDILQIQKLIEPRVRSLIRRQEDSLYALGEKTSENLRLWPVKRPQNLWIREEVLLLKTCWPMLSLW